MSTDAEMALRSVVLVLAEVCEEYGLDYAHACVLRGNDGMWLDVTSTKDDEPYAGWSGRGEE